MPYLEKLKLPRELLLDPLTGRAAAYDTRHQLIAELATARLVSYARQHAESVEAFDIALHAKGAPRIRPLPAWASSDVLERLQLIRMDWPSSTAPDAAWRAVPKR